MAEWMIRAGLATEIVLAVGVVVVLVRRARRTENGFGQ